MTIPAILGAASGSKTGSGRQMVRSVSGHGTGQQIQSEASIKLTKMAPQKNLAQMDLSATRTRSAKIRLKALVLMTFVPKVLD